MLDNAVYLLKNFSVPVGLGGMAEPLKFVFGVQVPNPPTPWGPVCGSLVYLPPIILPPWRAENGIYLGFAPPPRTSSVESIFVIFSSKNFKRPKNREDSSDLDENLTESIAAPKTFI